MGMSPPPDDSTEILIEPMRAVHIGLVWPLVRVAAPHLPIAAWQKYARTLAARDVPAEDLARRPRGILLARRRAQRFPCGLVCFQTKSDLTYGNVMTAEHLIALDLVDTDPVIRALVEHLERIGELLGCGAVRSVLHRERSEVTQSLLAAGLSPEGTTLSKSLVKRLYPGA